MANLVLEKRGRTIHLLKQVSKPVPHTRKRRKIALAATPQEFANKDKALEPDSQPMQIDQAASEAGSDKASGQRKGRGKAGSN